MFDRNDLKYAVSKLAMCEYFPPDPAARAAVMELLAKMCPHKQALEWLTDTMVNTVGRWHGPMELRGVLCTRYKPADGVESTCVSSRGFSPDELEMRALASHYERKSVESPRVVGLLAGEVTPEEHEELAAVLDRPIKTLKRPRLRDLKAAREFSDRVGL